MTRNSRPHPNQHPPIDARVCISFETAAQAKAAAKALIPDNVNMPAGLTVDISSRGRRMWVHVGGHGVKTATIANTLDEILEHISIARKVISADA